jgi:hypothetical protein
MKTIEEFIEELNDIINDINDKVCKATPYCFNKFCVESTLINGKRLTEIENICSKYACNAELSESDYMIGLGYVFIIKIRRNNI